MLDRFASMSTIIKRVIQTPKSGQQFLIHILGIFMSITGRINFLQMSRHSSNYGEQACRNQFERYFDFATINAEYINHNGSGHYIATFDLTYLRKAGKCTSGIGKYCGAARAVFSCPKSLLGLGNGFVVHC